MHALLTKLAKRAAIHQGALQKLRNFNGNSSKAFDDLNKMCDIMEATLLPEEVLLPLQIAAKLNTIKPDNAEQN